MKKALLFLCVALGAAQQLVAQSNTTDEGKVLYTARRDIKKLKISNDDLKKIGDEGLSLTSDYSKTNTAAASMPSLSNNSDNVQAISKAASVNISNIEADQALETVPGKSVNQAVKLAAEKDAAKFTLSHSMLKRFKKEHFPYTSDYFKPARQHVTNPAMLSDSTYIKTFKYKAYLEAKKARMHPVGHAIGTAFAVVATVAIIAAGVYEVNQM